MKLLFITSSRIGDAVLSTSILNYIIATHPGIEVTVAGAPLTLPLFESVPNLQRLIPLIKQSYSRHWIGLWQACRSESWDIIVDIRSSLVSYFLKTNKRYVWKSSSSTDHRVIQLGHMIGVNPPPSPTLWLKQSNIETASRIMTSDLPILALAPAANWIGKQWPPEMFAAFVKEFLRRHSAKIVIFAAPHEQDAIQEVYDAIPDENQLHIKEKLSLLDIAACLKQAKAFLGNDSGLMHMAAAMTIPTLGLFGPSDNRHYAPWGPKGHVLRTPESLHDFTQKSNFRFDAPTCFMENLKVETVIRSFSQIW